MAYRIRVIELIQDADYRRSDFDDRWGNQKGQDIAFLQAMMDLFDSEMYVDHNRVFSTGFSCGGMKRHEVQRGGLRRSGSSGRLNQA